MNKHLKNLDRIEFVVTSACTGRCKHCAEGGHKGNISIDASVAADAVRKIATRYSIRSVMTFGGEPLLYPEVVGAIHSAARDMNILKRQLITNGYFSKDTAVIKSVAETVADCGINDVLLSVDAFHQETIPLEYVKAFACSLKRLGVPLRTQPAWLVGREADNPYNAVTRGLLAEFEAVGIQQGQGNVVFPSGNALIYLKEYFDTDNSVQNPYTEDPQDLHTVSFAPNGDVLGGNIYNQDIYGIIAAYRPQ